MDEIICAEHLNVGYQTEAVLQDLNFKIYPGDITVILGKSGCGKTSLLKTLMGLIPDRGGSVSIFGTPLDYASEQSLGNLYRRIGVLYQGGALLNSMSLYENVALPIRMHFPDMPVAIEREMVFTRLAQVGLADNWQKLPGELSGGMKKRAALARALILDPEIIFCDEPAAGLDPITADGIDDLMLSLRDSLKITFIVVTHEIRSIKKIADRVIVLFDGRLLFWGKLDDALNRDYPFMESFFLEKPDQEQGA